MIGEASNGVAQDGGAGKYWCRQIGECGVTGFDTRLESLFSESFAGPSSWLLQAWEGCGLTGDVSSVRFPGATGLFSADVSEHT
jgi:hypothetical protein